MAERSSASDSWHHGFGASPPRLASRSHAAAEPTSPGPAPGASETPTLCSDQVEKILIELGVETFSNVILVLSDSAMVVLPPATVAAASAFAPAALP